MSVEVRTLFQSRTESFFDVNIVFIGVVSSIFARRYKNMTFLTILKRGSTTVYSRRTQSGKKLWGEKSMRGKKEFGRTFVPITQARRWHKTAWITSTLTIFGPYPANILILLNASITRWCSCVTLGALHGKVTLTVLIVLFASILLTIIITSYLIVRASKTTLLSYGIN